jgi:hypothetical protein
VGDEAGGVEPDLDWGRSHTAAAAAEKAVGKEIGSSHRPQFSQLSSELLGRGARPLSHPAMDSFTTLMKLFRFPSPQNVSAKFNLEIGTSHSSLESAG